MTRCIFCKKEIPENQIKQHIAEEHLGIKNATSLQAAPKFMIAPKTTTLNTTEKNEIPKNLNSEKPNTPTPLEKEKPKKRYLAANEILTLLQNSYAVFPKKEILPCPITKQGE